MAGGIVGWHFFDVESGQLPEDSSPAILPGGGEGRIVVLAATPFAQKDKWASRAAVSMAQDWAGKGLRVFLMDLGLESPSLHDVLGLPNDEGVSDAFLFGASVQHIAKPALDDAIFFASAGTAAGDPEDVLGHTRWNDLAGGFSEADATLLLFLPCDIPGAGKILSRATDIVFLSAQGELADTHLGPASIKVVSMMGPLGSPPEEVEVPTPVPADTPEIAGPEGTDLPLESAPDDVSWEEPEADSGEVSSEKPAKDPDAVSWDDPEADGEKVGDESLSETPPDPASDGGFGMGGGFELADGFGEVDLDEAPAADGGFGAEAGDAMDFGGDLGLIEDEEEDTVHDLGIGADFTGELDAPAFADDEPTEAAPPDFGADFVEMPSDDDDGGGFEPAGFEDEGDFGSGLVQGPDFGGPAPESPQPDYEEASTGGMETPPEEGAEPQKPRLAPRRRPPPKKGAPVGLMVSIVVALAAVGAVVGTAFGFLQIPGLVVLQEYTGSVPDPALTREGPQATDPVIRYSLVIFDDYAVDDLEQAAGMVEALQAELPDFLFFLTPLEVDGTVTYLLMAGPAINPLEVENIRTPMAAELPREDADAWEVRETPRAFYLGERGTLEEAQDYLATVEAQGLDGYILHSHYEDDSEGFVILTGGFQGPEDARRLQIMLRRSGFGDAPLIERRGLFPG